MDLLRDMTDELATMGSSHFFKPPPVVRHLPDDARLPMPEQDLGLGQLSPNTPSTSPANIGHRRAFLFTVTALIAALGMAVLGQALSWHGWQTLEIAFFILFSLLFTWMAFGFVSYSIGLWVMHHKTDDLGLTPEASVPTLHKRTAILMPICNEDAQAVASRLNKIRQSLIATHQSGCFDIFVLSDTQDLEAADTERRVFRFLLQSDTHPRVYYRRRAVNKDRKSGNIADWCRRFGADYAHMVVLDADSLMSGDTLVRLSGAMEQHSDVGLIQTTPCLINQTSLFARCAQFAAKLYGPAAACGTAWWSGSESNYWGHNAIIRVRAFTEAAGLPHLPGKAPFGGHILSHDFVEAALLRRAGWGVHMAPRLEGSYEESPPTLVDALQRDRRWCQGNIQHAAVVASSGLHWVNRFHLIAGIINYLTAPLWLAMVAMGAALSLSQATLNVTSGLTIMVIITFGLLLGPKIMAVLIVLVREDDRSRFGGRLAIISSLITEVVLSTLLTPVIMLSHSFMIASVLAGRKSGWNAQRRAGYTLDPQEMARIFLPHTLIGLSLATIIIVFSPEALVFSVGVIVSLILSAPLTALTAQTLPRTFCDLLRIPEEHQTAHGKPMPHDAVKAAREALRLV